MTPAQIARLAASAPTDPDPARCRACGARSEAPTLSAARIGALYVCEGCGAAWWAQDGNRDAVCGPGGIVETQAEGEAA